MQLRWYWAHYAASAPYRVLVEASIRAAGWLRDGRSGDRRALNDRWHRRCTPAGAFGGAARQWRTGHHVALPHPPDSGRGLRLMWPFRKSAETRSSSGGFTMPRPADIIRHLPGRTPIMGADAAWEVAMISRIWDENATIVVAKRCSWRSRSASGGWAIRPAQGWHSRTPGRQHVQSTAIRSRSAWGITRQAVPPLFSTPFEPA